MLTEQNYFSPEADWEYCSNSQYKSFFGTRGQKGCEARTMAKLRGEWKDESPSKALLIGSYVDEYFSGTLEQFKKKHPEIFLQKEYKGKPAGSLKSDFEHANKMIARVERDEFMMKTLSGGMQQIFTFEFAGLKWKIKIDSYHVKRAIIDLKTMESIKKEYYVPLEGKLNAVEFWGYNIQGAIYQKGVEINTGDKLPFLIAAVSKEPEPDIDVLGFYQDDLDQQIALIEANAPRIIELKAGKGQPPKRCEICDYCKNTKILTGPIHYKDIIR